jgi:hypothetical protein
VSGNVCHLRLSDGGRMVSTVGERDIGLVEREHEKWNMKNPIFMFHCSRMRLEDERIDKRGVEGHQ